MRLTDWFRLRINGVKEEVNDIRYRLEGRAVGDRGQRVTHPYSSQNVNYVWTVLEGGFPSRLSNGQY